ncbi:MAG: putative porin [Tannerellaceae bacterium]|nr:putative porin [Tannerellaceae bacterium]
MRHCLYIVIFLVITITAGSAQERGGGGRGRGLSLSDRSSLAPEAPDSVMPVDSVARVRVVAYRLTRDVGDPYVAPMDTNRLNFGNSTLVEGNSLAVGYLSNLGNPAQSRIFSERKEPRDFIFADAYDYYITTPENAAYYDTRLPYTNILYTSGGASTNKEDRLKGVLTWNFGKRINLGAEMDYIYARGLYASNGNKPLSYRIFGSYRSDHYEAFGYLSNYNLLNYENGGLSDDTYLTDPDNHAEKDKSVQRKSYPTRYYDTWNRVRGKQYFLSHRYNLGFYRETDRTDEEGNPVEKFVPVSSIVHTFEYEDNRRRFISNINLDTSYVKPDPAFTDPTHRKRLDAVYGLDVSLDDFTSAWALKNTVALSLREGFQDWIRFGLSAFARIEKRRFSLPAKIPGLEYTETGSYGDPLHLDYAPYDVYDEFSTFLGGELSKRLGSVLTYSARGEFCPVGDDLGEIRLNGDLQTNLQVFGRKATIRANGYFRNVRPAFYQRHHHSRYFWWDTAFSNTQQFYAGGEISQELTRTTLSASVEGIRNHVYFDLDGLPRQHSGLIQVISARLKQNLYFRALGWENEVAYQSATNRDILPLPPVSLYTNLFLHVKLAKVLTVQIGADMHYNIAYYAPYYEPATQQFRLQDEKKIGGYPLINGYVNFHLKQARFFIMGYNLSSLFVDPDYFSLLHYPLNPMVIRMGISVTFNN